MKYSKILGALVALSPLYFGAMAKGQIAYGLTNGGTTLVSFNLSSPGTIVNIGNFSGAATGVLDLDFRPANGVLYAYSNANTIVSINTTNGVTTFVSTPSIVSSSPILGIDFNPAADRLRVVNINDQNLRFVTDTGASVPAGGDGPLAYGATDANFGANPSIADVAYTFNDNNPATGTTLYYIDYLLNTLVTTSDPNAGTLTTIGGLGFDVSPDAGFDIFTSAEGVNTAYLSDAGFLRTINLATGATLTSTALGANITNLAIAPIPEPGSVLLGAVAAGLALARRRRSA